MAAPPEPTTPPIIQGPTAKEKKYDRQLRLWAAAGQAALEDAHILLVNSGPGVAGVETLKNLVLPGITITVSFRVLVSLLTARTQVLADTPFKTLLQCVKRIWV